MDIFSNKFVVNLECLFVKMKINENEAVMAHLKKIGSQQDVANIGR